TCCASSTPALGSRSWRRFDRPCGDGGPGEPPRTPSSTRVDPRQGRASRRRWRADRFAAMNIRIVAAFACTWCLACGPKNAAPSTVEPTAVSQDAGSSEDADLDAGEDLDEDETLDEEQETEEAAEADAGVDPDGEITFKLHNLCKRAMKYGLGPLERETEILDPKTIKAGGV